jgi:hypothetical protein
MYFRVFLYITNCARIVLKEWYMFRGNLAKTQGDMRKSVSATKKFPKQKFFVRAFGSDISCNQTSYRFFETKVYNMGQIFI